MQTSKQCLNYMFSRHNDDLIDIINTNDNYQVEFLNQAVQMAFPLPEEKREKEGRKGRREIRVRKYRERM